MEIMKRVISCICKKRMNMKYYVKLQNMCEKFKCKSYIFRFSGIQFTEFCQHSLFGNLVVCHLTFGEWPRGWFTQCYKNRISRDTVKKILCFLCKQWKIDKLGIIRIMKNMQWIRYLFTRYTIISYTITRLQFTRLVKHPF